MHQRIEQFAVSALTVELFDEAIAGHARIVSDLSFSLRAGEGLGITGESGSGKTTLSLALSGLLPVGSRLAAQKVALTLDGADGAAQRCVNLAEAGRLGDRLRELRGRYTFTLFQEPRASLNPHRTIGWQLKRCLRRRTGYASLKPGGAGDARASIEYSVRSTVSATTGREERSPSTALIAVGLDPDIGRHYPHELSTGMCQRVFLAMASLLGSSILVADEPFASVDADTQRRLTQLVRDWMQQRGLMLILVSHDLDLLGELTNHTVVMYRGQVAESGPTRDVLSVAKPVHPYTRLLKQVSDSTHRPATIRGGGDVRASRAACHFAARCAWADAAVCVEPIPATRAADVSRDTARSTAAGTHVLRCVKHPITDEPSAAEPQSSSFNREPAASALPVGSRLNEVDSNGEPGGGDVLRVHGLAKQFRTGWIRRRVNSVLADVTFALREGERLGIMGPSGQGKTTLARVVLGLERPDRGMVQLSINNGWTDVVTPGRRRTCPVELPRHVQLLYQDADLVLDPAARVAGALMEAYQVFDPRMTRAECYRLAASLLDELALPPAMLEAYPYRLSGGERKRVALARCLAAFGCPFPARPSDPWRVFVLDEPTAGVDVFLQAVLGQFLIWVQQRLRLSYLVISHDESFVRRFCHRTLRLDNGHVFADGAESVRSQA